MMQMKDFKNSILDLNYSRNYSLFLFIVIIFSVNNAAFSQNYYFKHYNIENGLTQSQVTRIYQDSQRYLWLGTSGGVSRFNGADFVNYTKIDGLNDDLVTSICQDKDEILLRTGEGISSIKDGKIKNIFKSHDENWARTKDLTKDSEGNIWFINGERLNSLSAEKVRPVSVTASKNEFVLTLALNNQGKLFTVIYGKGIYSRVGNNWVNVLPFTGIYKKEVFTKILFDNAQAGRMYLLTSKKLYVADNENISAYKNKMLDTLKDILFVVAQDKQGILWLGTEKGACYLRDKDPVRFTGSNGFSSANVFDIYIDHQDNVWLATNGDGFYKFQGFDLLSINKTNNPFPLVMGVGLDNANNIWIGTDGHGLIKYDGNKLSNIYLPSANPFSKYIIAISHNTGQPLLVGTIGGLWTIDQGKFYNLSKKYGLPNFVTGVIYDSENSIWMICNKGCYHIKKDGSISFVRDVQSQIQTIAQIGRDSMLMGVSNGIVLVKKGVVDTGFKFKELSSSTVISLIRFGNFIIGGTLNEGLFSIDLLKNTVRKYTTKDGLRSNAIWSLTIDKNGTIWAGTGKGIEKFIIEPKTQNIHPTNNLFSNPVVEYNQNAILNYKNKIWAGTAKGLYIFNVVPSSEINSQKPVINIESVKISDEDNRDAGNDNPAGTAIPKIIKFKYGHKHISIIFRGIFYADPENLQYQYQLKGLDKQFSPLSKFNRVDFTVIPPGNYDFEVRVLTANGSYSAIKSIPIIIIPAFYQTYFFYIILFLLFISLVILIQWSINHRKARQRLIMESIKHQEQVRIRRQTAEDFHDDIGNKLTRIVVLTDILDRKSVSQNEELKSLISQIRENAANLYSGAKDILWALDPQSDDLSEVILRIKNFAIDLFSNTDIDLVFEDFELHYNKPLPLEFSRNLNMIFKELLNNILKHANASQVILTAKSNQGKVEITLIENGKGYIETGQEQGKGLANIKVRTKRINGLIIVHSGPGKGTKTTLKFDLEV